MFAASSGTRSIQRERCLEDQNQSIYFGDSTFSKFMIPKRSVHSMLAGLMSRHSENGHTYLLMQFHTLNVKLYVVRFSIVHIFTPFPHVCSFHFCSKILWDERYLGDIGNKALVTLDGTDLPVQMKFAEKFLSHKFKGNGLKYEVGVCILTGRIVWIHGPCRAGENDVNLSRQAFVSFLDDNEMAIADSGYRGEFAKLKTPDYMHFRTVDDYANASVARSRHETVNQRLKNMNALVKPFRHDLEFHSSCFRAVAVIEELNIENGQPLFEVLLYDEGRVQI